MCQWVGALARCRGRSRLVGPVRWAVGAASCMWRSLSWTQALLGPSRVNSFPWFDACWVWFGALLGSRGGQVTGRCRIVVPQRGMHLPAYVLHRGRSSCLCVCQPWVWVLSCSRVCGLPLVAQALREVLLRASSRNKERLAALELDFSNLEEYARGCGWQCEWSGSAWAVGRGSCGAGCLVKGGGGGSGRGCC